MHITNTRTTRVPRCKTFLASVNAYIPQLCFVLSQDGEYMPSRGAEGDPRF